MQTVEMVLGLAVAVSGLGAIAFGLLWHRVDGPEARRLARLSAATEPQAIPVPPHLRASSPDRGATSQPPEPAPLLAELPDGGAHDLDLGLGDSGAWVAAPAPRDGDETQVAIPRHRRNSTPGVGLPRPKPGVDAITHKLPRPGVVARSNWENETMRQSGFFGSVGSSSRLPSSPPTALPDPNTLAAICDAVVGPQRVLVTAERRPGVAGTRLVYAFRGGVESVGDTWVVDASRYDSGADVLADVRALADLWHRCPKLAPR